MVIKDLRTTFLRVESYNGLLKIVVRTPDPGLGGYPPPLYPKCSEESAQSSKEKHTYMLLPGRGALISCISRWTWFIFPSSTVGLPAYTYVYFVLRLMFLLFYINTVC